MGRALRTQRWKYCVVASEKDAWRDPGSDRYVEKYLYDLWADPYELNNLAGIESHLEISEMVRERLIRRMVDARELKPTIKLAPKRPSGELRVSGYGVPRMGRIVQDQEG